MKYVYSSLIFLVFLLIIVNITNFSYEQEVETYDMISNEISNVDISVENVNINVLSSVDKDVRLEHNFSPDKNLSSNIYSYIDENVLYIKQYPYETNPLITKREDLNIYIPSAYDFDTLTIKTTSGEVSIDDLEIPTISTTSSTGQLNIANVKATDFAIGGDNYTVNINDLSADNLDLEMNSSFLYVNNSFIDDVVLNLIEDSTVNIGKLVGSTININAPKATVKLEWTSGFNYIVTTDNIINNEDLILESGKYSYSKADNAATIEYTINGKKVDVEIASTDE